MCSANLVEILAQRIPIQKSHVMNPTLTISPRLDLAKVNQDALQRVNLPYLYLDAH